METTSIPISYLVGTFPLLILILSAGIAWGVTTATVKSLRNALLDVTEAMKAVTKDFTEWKQDRLHAVTLTKDCSDLRQMCGIEQNRRIESLTNKFDGYIETQNTRWNDLATSIKVLCDRANRNDKENIL